MITEMHCDLQRKTCQVAPRLRRLLLALAAGLVAGFLPSAKVFADWTDDHPPLTPSSSVGTYLALDLSTEANDHFAQPVGKGPIKVGAVPFRLPQGAQDALSLHEAHWFDWQTDFPWSHETPTPRHPHDPQMPLLMVPVADYTAAHVLAVADDDPGHVPTFTLRMGTVTGNGNTLALQRDFAGQVPRRSEIATAAAVVKTAGESLCYVRVPITLAFAQDMDAGRQMDIEVTKEVRLARRNPDPARFRYRPLGLPSGVRIAAITLEKSPLQMRVTGGVPANAFAEPQTPTFNVTLTNITRTAQRYALALEAVHLRGAKTRAERSGQVAAGKAAVVSVPMAVKTRGYYDLTVTLSGEGQQELLCRRTSFALLPPDTRKHRNQSPFGTYDYGWTHYCCGDYDQVGPLYVKLGMHYGMFDEEAVAGRRKFGLVKGNEPRLDTPQEFDNVRAKNPDLPPMALVFHEACLSERNIERVPDVFTDRHYTLDGEEKKQLATMIAEATATAAYMRHKHPEVQLALGNDPLPTQEELLRGKIPAKAFDSLGNESASMGNPPEAQPPNYLANNASLWMDRQMLNAYGYADKAVTQCHEVCYPSTNPGNLCYQSQADYFVRHAIHSMAWGVPVFRPGVLMDVGGNYRWGAWGASGFCHTYPEMNVKPSFVAFATMTLMLDGAKFVREVPLGSLSLYGAQFARPDGSQLFVLWTLRGRRPVALSVGGGDWKVVDDQGNESAAAPSGGKLELTLTPSPIYLVGSGQVASGDPGAPVYAEKPEGKVSPLAALDSLDDWAVESGHSIELEWFDFMSPRRKGDFTFEAVPAFEGKSGAIRVTPKPLPHVKDTLAMPMYAVLAHKKGIPVPGTPTEIGLWINGNSGWGRVIFELTDASGQRWITIGAQQDPKKQGSAPQAVLPADVLAKFPNPGTSDWNTEDQWAVSRINFDGWRYVAFPMPGNYPGERYAWAANSQWRSDKDHVVHYPLTLRKLVVELNEKVLHMKTYAPVPRGDIYFKDLTVSQGDTVRVKKCADDYDPAVQMK